MSNRAYLVLMKHPSRPKQQNTSRVRFDNKSVGCVLRSFSLFRTENIIYSGNSPFVTLTAADQRDDTISLSHTTENAAVQAAAEANKQLTPVPDHDQWRANPDYFSGGSSDFESADKAKLGLDEEAGLTDSDILTNLKQEISNDNGFTTKVVRLEVGRLMNSHRRC